MRHHSHIWTALALMLALMAWTSPRAAAGEAFIAYDGMEYLPGTADFNGGWGWANAWTPSNSINVVSHALTYPGLEGVGNTHLALLNNASVSRRLQVPVTNAFVAFLVHSTYDVQPIPPATVSFRYNGSTVFRLETTTSVPTGVWRVVGSDQNGNPLAVNTGVQMTTGPHLVVVELRPTTFRVYIGSAVQVGEVPPATYYEVYPLPNRPVSIDEISFTAGVDLRIDEMRVAHTYRTLWYSDFVRVTLEELDTEASEEGELPALFRLRRTGSVIDNSDPLPVRVQISGTAEFGNDYIIRNLTSNEIYSGGGSQFVITIPANQEYVDLQIVPNDDQRVEGIETLTLQVLPDDARVYSLGTTTSATARIDDDDTITVVTVTAPDNIAIEGDWMNPAYFQINRSGGSVDDDLVVRLAWSGSAIMWSDYEVTEPIEAIIPAGEYSVDIWVLPMNDNLVEGTETVTLTIVPEGTYQVGSQASATISIVDDDQQVQVRVEAIDVTAVEGQTNTARFRVQRLSALPTESATVVYLEYGGTAIYGVDYAGVDAVDLPRYVEIPAGGTLQEVIIEVQALVDDLVEGAESLVVSIAPDPAYQVVGGPVSLSILDASVVQVGIDVVDAVAGEGDEANPAVLRVWRRAASNEDELTVFVRWSGTATPEVDYQAVQNADQTVWNAVVIPAGEWFVDVQINPEDDDLVEGDETAILTIQSDDRYVTQGASSATVTIRDNDAPVRITIDVVDGYAYEGVPGSNVAVFRVRREGQTDADVRVTLGYSGTAAFGSDYIGRNGQDIRSVLIPGGGNVGEALVEIEAVNDDLVEGAETIRVEILQEQSTQTYTIGSGAITLTIYDDDEDVVVSLRALDLVMPEAPPYNVARFRVVRTGSTDRNILVHLTYTGTAIMGHDYYRPPMAILVPGGGQEREVEVVLRAINDREPEGDEIIIVQIVQGGASGVNINLGYTIGTPNAMQITLTDDDLLPTVGLRVIKATMNEMHPSDPAIVRVERSPVSALPLTVNLTYVGTAAPNIDYVAPMRTITLQAGQASQDIMFYPLNDEQLEGQETITVMLQPSSTASYQVDAQRATATLFIYDTGSETTGGGAMQFAVDSEGCGAGGALALLLPALVMLRLRRRN